MDDGEYKKMDMLQRTNWWYLGRRAIVSFLFLKYCDKPVAVLDIGCGTGEGRSIVPEGINLTGIDHSDMALSIAKDKGYQQLLKSSGDSLPFENESFDALIMLDVLEHIENDHKVLSECFRVLKRGGVLILTVPAYMWLWSGHDEAFGHKRRYTKKGISKKVRQHNFSVLFCSYYVCLLFPIIASFRTVGRLISSQKKSHFFPIPKFLNNFLYKVMLLESLVLKRKLALPFGSSILAVLKKPEVNL